MMTYRPWDSAKKNRQGLYGDAGQTAAAG